MTFPRAWNRPRCRLEAWSQREPYVEVGGDVDIAAVATLFADRTRASILGALADGRALAASVLADEAGVSAPAASAQLAKLTKAG